MILAQHSPLSALMFDLNGVFTLPTHLKIPPVFALSIAFLAALSAWAAGWPPLGVGVNFALAAIVASFLNSHIQNKAD